MNTRLMKYISFFALAVSVLSLMVAIKLLTITTLAVVEKEPDAINIPAPELVGGPWLNTPKGEAIKLADRRGKVTIVEFWTFACINCLHNLPSYARWQKQFADQDVVIIGVHTPETESERVTANVARRVKQLGIAYPILIDEQHANWNRWQQEAWPTVYLIDKQGRVRYRWEGELNYKNAGGEAKMTRLVEQLLKETY
jgi:peroxiredoxin